MVGNRKNLQNVRFMLAKAAEVWYNKENEKIWGVAHEKINGIDDKLYAVFGRL